MSTAIDQKTRQEVREKYGEHFLKWEQEQMDQHKQSKQEKACNTIFGQETCDELLQEEKASIPALVFENGTFKASQVETGQKAQKPASQAVHFFGQPQQQQGYQAAMEAYYRTVRR